jgi:hypothetical protein
MVVTDDFPASKREVHWLDSSVHRRALPDPVTVEVISMEFFENRKKELL